MLTDRVVTPPEMRSGDGACFVERFVYLQGCYMVNDYRQSMLDQILGDVINASEAKRIGVPHHGGIDCFMTGLRSLQHRLTCSHHL